MTDCETLRERLAADPATGDTAFERHAAGCAPCRAFRDRLFKTEELIGRALGIDAGAVTRRSDTTDVAGGAGARWVTQTASLAAGILVALILWDFSGIRPEPGPAELAQAIVDHWEHEPESLIRTDAEVSDAILAEVLYGTAELDLARMRTVSYAMICRVGGRFVPHLVVQGETGPYMVLLLPGRTLESAVPLSSAQGLAGHILPSGNGSIAVLGALAEDLDEMESLVASAVAWSI